MARAVLHVDMDAFFAAVEEREQPAIEGRPVVVGADPEGGEGRGVVSTANYEARTYGIHSAMPISVAYRRCPQAVFLPVRSDLYREVSQNIRAIFERYTDMVEPISVDEAFLDVTASRRLFGPPVAIARAIQEDVREEEQLSCSVGAAPSKFVAKVASDLDKPGGIVVVGPGEERAFLAPLSIDRLWGAGPKAVEQFHRIGVTTIGEAAALEPATMVALFGESRGMRFHQLARGIDTRPVEAGTDRKSLGKESTFAEDVRDRRRVERELLALSEAVALRLRQRDLAGSTVTVKVRFEGFDTVTHQRTLRQEVSTTDELYAVARELFREADQPERKVRLVGVTVSRFEDARTDQLGLFERNEAPDRHEVADAIDRITERYGEGAVTRAALLEDD